MSKMHHDDTSDLKTIAEVLKRVYGVRDSFLPTFYHFNLSVGTVMWATIFLKNVSHRCSKSS